MTISGIHCYPAPVEGVPLARRLTLDGVELLGDAELLSLVLGSAGGGARLATLSADLLDEHGGVGGLLRTGIGELAARRGMGPAKAARLTAAIELGRRAVAAASIECAPKLPDHRAVFVWGQSKLGILDHEELWVLALDGRNGLRAARRAASGGVHGLHVGVRDVLRIAIREAASALVLVHNHPSGDPEPSREDGAVTHAVVAGARTLGTPLVDHVVVARGRSSSQLELGLLTSDAR